MQFNIHEAKTQFSKLVAAVERGETVTICRNGAPVIDCVPAKSAGPFPFGAWADLASVPNAPGSLDHMAAPTDAEELDAMGL
jgi:prevent-host-death family protein